MAVYIMNSRDDMEISYTGCVLDTYERNGYDDSDFFALCWDRDKKEMVRVMYDTTRCGGMGRAEVDIDEDTLREVYRYSLKQARTYFDNGGNERQARKVQIGDDVCVVRGTKIKKGTTGRVFWIGKKYNPWSREDEERVGILKPTGERVFLRLDYVNVIGWENRLVHGKARKRMIRKDAIRSLPLRYRHLFCNN